MSEVAIDSEQVVSFEVMLYVKIGIQPTNICLEIDCGEADVLLLSGLDLSSISISVLGQEPRPGRG